MAENKLTDKSLRALKPTPKEQLLGDGGGLWVRVLPLEKGGAINFYYRFEFNGKERRFNCGTYPETSLAAAREKRTLARRIVQSGIDPIQQAEQERLSRSAAQALEQMEKSVQELFNDWKRVYLEVHRKDRGEAVEAAMKRDVLPRLGAMKAKDVRLPHIVQVIDQVLDRGARRTANMTLSLMRQMFRHGLARGIVETDPTLGLSKKQAGGNDVPVDRNLSFAEVTELLGKIQASDLQDRMKAAIRLLLATGARVGELLKGKWDDIDLTAKTWTIPVENSKNKRAHLIHLSPFAIDQIELLSVNRAGPYLLAGRDIKLPLSEKSVSKAIRDRIRKEPLKKRTPRTGTLLLTGGEWSPHDLRRTMASRMGDLEIEPHIIERCLNHIQQGIIGVYQRQEYIEQRKAAFEKWGKKLKSLGMKK